MRTTIYQIGVSIITIKIIKYLMKIKRTLINVILTRINTRRCDDEKKRFFNILKNDQAQ